MTTNNIYNSRPITFAVYKGISGKNGVLQFDLRPFNPDAVESDMDAKETKRAKKGAVFITAAKAVGNSQYDYDNSIKFSMSENDLAQFLVGTNTTAEPKTELVNIYHKIEREGKEISKSLRVQQGNPDKTEMPTFMVTLSEKGSTDKLVTVPVSAHEMFALRQLFTSALPRILGWG